MNKKSQLWIIPVVIIGLVALVGIGYWVKYSLLPVRVVTNQIDSAGNIIDKTYKAENAIYNYEWFKTQYEKIQAIQQQEKNTHNQIVEFKNTYGNASSWDFSTKDEYNRLNTVFLGLQNQEQNYIAEYNARAKMANRNIFMDKLPLNVDKMLW